MHTPTHHSFLSHFSIPHLFHLLYVQPSKARALFPLYSQRYCLSLCMSWVWFYIPYRYSPSLWLNPKALVWFPIPSKTSPTHPPPLSNPSQSLPSWIWSFSVCCSQDSTLQPLVRITEVLKELELGIIKSVNQLAKTFSAYAMNKLFLWAIIGSLWK